jgi:hypothetical protein
MVIPRSSDHYMLKSCDTSRCLLGISCSYNIVHLLFIYIDRGDKSDVSSPDRPLTDRSHHSREPPRPPSVLSRGTTTHERHDTMFCQVITVLAAVNRSINMLVWWTVRLAGLLHVL